MTEHPNETLVRRGYQAFAEGDLDALAGILAPEIVQRAPGDNLVSGEHKGRDAVLDRYRRLFELSGGTARVEVEDVQADGDDRVVARHRVTAEREGRRLDTRDRLVFTIAGGRVVEIEESTNDPAAKDAFWA